MIIFIVKNKKINELNLRNMRYKALISSQQFRILQDLTNLCYLHPNGKITSLTLEEVTELFYITAVRLKEKNHKKPLQLLAKINSLIYENK